MIGSFRHKGLEEIHVTGTTRRIGTANIGKCVRILQLLEVAGQPEDMNIVGFRFQGLRGKPPPMGGARDWELPDQLRLGGRKRVGYRS
jgi:plasmid maintenance system killer protein